MKCLFLACTLFASSTAFSQTTDIWTGGENHTGTEFYQSTNWSPFLPAAFNGDTAEWNGTAPGNLTLFFNTSFIDGPGGSGLNFYLHFAQTGSVSIATTLASMSVTLQNIDIDAGAGAFTFGGTDQSHVVVWTARPAGTVHTLINNSTNVATLTPWIDFKAGGGAVWTMDFSGTGNWQCNSYLVDDNGPNRVLQIDGPGTMIWNPAGLLNFSGIASPISINGGALVLQGPHPRLNSQAIQMNGNFIFAPTNPAAAQTLAGSISGTGNLRVESGMLTLSGPGTYTSTTIVSNGNLIVNGTNFASSTVIYGGTLGGAGRFHGPITLSAGTTLAPGAPTSIGTLTVSNDLTIAGNVVIKVNKSAQQSNDLIVVSGVATNTGTGILLITNLGPALQVGDTFQLFNKPLLNGSIITITGARATWTNNLAVDGSISVLSVAPPPVLSFMQNGTNLQFAWSDFLNHFKLQTQTNLIGSNWMDIPGGTNSVTVPIDPANGPVFFRLVSTP